MINNMFGGGEDDMTEIKDTEGIKSKSKYILVSQDHLTEDNSLL